MVCWLDTFEGCVYLSWDTSISLNRCVSDWFHSGKLATLRVTYRRSFEHHKPVCISKLVNWCTQPLGRAHPKQSNIYGSNSWLTSKNTLTISRHLPTHTISREAPRGKSLLLVVSIYSFSRLSHCNSGACRNITNRGSVENLVGYLCFW